MCVGQKTAVRSWFSQSTVGSGNQTLVVWLSRQVLLPAEPAHQPVCLDAHCLAFGLLFWLAKTGSLLLGWSRTDCPAHAVLALLPLLPSPSARMLALLHHASLH